LSNPNTHPSISKDEFFEKINWYDSYSTQNFQYLWPNVIDLVEKYL
jgi:hypothetical protein